VVTALAEGCIIQSLGCDAPSMLSRNAVMVQQVIFENQDTHIFEAFSILRNQSSQGGGDMWDEMCL
jgi:hypothetical protein